MIGWLILGLYLLGYVACWRTVVWTIASDFAFDAVDGESLVFGGLFGSFATLFWPVILTGLAVNRLYIARGDTITSLIVPRAEKRRVALDERERRIAELEREVGIR